MVLDFLSHFSFDAPRDLPDMEMLEEAGLLSKAKMLAGEFPDPLPAHDDDQDDDEEAADRTETG
ncbi:hypothetical protein [Bradyrhizobium sp. 31Argb]|uniref:hypothetical protein n=1 Tax=Bradyrhizobium sp. 31Argb TaxID=3141247 RepID=UPI003747B819